MGMCGRYITPDEAALEREWYTLPRDFEYLPVLQLRPNDARPDRH